MRIGIVELSLLFVLALAVATAVFVYLVGLARRYIQLRERELEERQRGSRDPAPRS